MNINIKTSSLTLTPSISDYVEKRLETAKRLLEADTTAVCDMELARTTLHHKQGDIFKAEVHIIGKDINIYAVSEREDLYAAIDAVKDEVVRNLTSSKGKRLSLMRRGAAQVKNIIKGFLPDRGNA